MADLICDAREHCNVEDCEHKVQHERFFDCTDGECATIDTAICIPIDPKIAKEKRIKELQDEIDQKKRELLEFVKGSLDGQ